MTNRRTLMLMVGATVLRAVASLILGLAAGHRILVSMGFAKFASELGSIPGSSGIVGLALTPLMFAIGVGLTWKGASESRMRSVTRGTLAGSTIRVVPRDPEDGYRIYSRVSYYVDGVRYETEGSHEDIHSSGAEARRRLGELHPGDSVEVFYKPAIPGP